MNHYLIFIISFLVTYSTLPLFRKLALKLGILDFPNHRKIHKQPTPLLGGVAIYVGVIVALLFSLKNLYFYLPLLIGGTIILVVGLIDDIRNLSASFRLLCQFVVASIVIGLGLQVSFLPRNLWGDIGEIIVTLLWIIGVTNIYNYLDGLDGLAAGSAVVNLFCFAIILYTTGQHPLGLLAIILIAACLGFIPYNFRKAKIFLGDAGSTFLGFILACIGLMGNWAEDGIAKISIPVLILGVPIFDMIFTTIMRIKEVKIKTFIEWLEYGAKDHFHHYLLALGLPPLGAVIFIYFITLSLGISAIMVSNDSAIEALLTLLQASIIFGVIATLIIVGKGKRNSIDAVTKPQ
jgi:UDP-GlcNAc:undecaprenyl-phosphate GlcNAc-1-phosphate transferase